MSQDDTNGQANEFDDRDNNQTTLDFLRKRKTTIKGQASPIIDAREDISKLHEEIEVYARAPTDKREKIEVRSFVGWHRDGSPIVEFALFFVFPGGHVSKLPGSSSLRYIIKKDQLAYFNEQINLLSAHFSVAI